MAELKVISKKYNDKDELIVENFEEEVSKNVVPSLVGKDISVEGITSKGIANIGDVTISGDLVVQGEGKGKITCNELNGVPNPSVKPIYCHPISITNTATKMRLGLFIFNNSLTPFTLETFKTFIDDLYTEIGDTVRIITTGAYTNNGCCIASYIGKNPSGYYLSGLKASDGSSGTLSNVDFSELFPSSTTDFNDGVNKIN